MWWLVSALACGGALDESSSDSADLEPLPEVLILYSEDRSSGDDSVTWFHGETVEADCPTDCSANTAPTLDTPIYTVNGEVVRDPSPREGDAVAAFFPFADAECNLACGLARHSFSSPRASSNGIYTLPSNLPCGTEGSDVYVGMSLNEVQVGDYTLTFRVDDACEGESERVSGSFTVY